MPATGKSPACTKINEIFSAGKRAMFGWQEESLKRGMKWGMEWDTRRRTKPDWRQWGQSGRAGEAAGATFGLAVDLGDGLGNAARAWARRAWRWRLANRP